MVMIGTDSHKRTHTFVAVDDIGRRLGECTLRANTDGHLQLLTWAARFGQVTFALEDCRHLTRRLEGDLLRAGQRVVRVPTRLMAGARRYLGLEVVARSRVNIVPRTEPEIGADALPALTA